MSCVIPNILLSSFEIEIEAYIPNNDVDLIEVDRGLVVNDVISSLSNMIARSLRDLGVELYDCHAHERIFYIRDEDVDKIANLNLEIGARELLIDLCSRQHMSGPYGGLTTGDLVKLSGSVYIEGFEVVN